MGPCALDVGIFGSCCANDQQLSQFFWKKQTDVECDHQVISCHFCDIFLGPNITWVVTFLFEVMALVEPNRIASDKYFVPHEVFGPGGCGWWCCCCGGGGGGGNTKL